MREVLPLNALVFVRAVTIASFQFLVPVLLSLSAIGATHAEVGRIELYGFNSTTLTDQEFLTGKKQGKDVVISGVLRYPRIKLDKYPVVILVHGSGGISGYVDDWAQEINNMGIAVFIIDSFTARGLYKINNDQSKLGRLAQVVDSYRALDLLASDERIDPAKIVVMGFSRGGQVSLYSSLKRFHKMHGSDNQFAGYIAFYPSCITSYQDENNTVDKPIRIFHGESDNYNPVSACSEYVERLKANGKDVNLSVYEGAHHVFDYTKLTKPIVLKKAQTTRSCRLKESDNGKIENLKNGNLFTYNDPCVELGPTIQFNPEAYEQSRKEVSSFLKKLLM